MSVVLLVGASSSSRLFEILDLLHFEEDTPTETNLILIMVEIRINATFLNCRRELRFPTFTKGRDSEIAPTKKHGYEL